jgi:hypothetical protein
MGKEIVKKTVKETVLYTDIVTVCGEDPQYCPPGKRKFLKKSLNIYEMNKI